MNRRSLLTALIGLPMVGLTSPASAQVVIENSVAQVSQARVVYGKSFMEVYDSQGILRARLGTW